MRKFIISNNKKTVEFTSQKEYSILALCKREGLKVPHSCFEGRCGLCKAKLLKGAVDENFTRGLSQELRSEKFILTCQSFPTSDLIHLDFKE